MSYTVKLNNVELDTSKIERKAIDSLSISADDMLFSVKASILRFVYRNCDEDDLTFRYELNIIEIFDDSVLFWCGYIKLTSINYNTRKRIYKFTCYDFMKLLPLITMNTFDRVGDYFRRPISDVLEFLTYKINSYFNGKAYSGFEISYEVDEEPSDINIEYDIPGVFDDNNYHPFVSGSVGTIKYAELDDVIVFYQNNPLGGEYFYYGVLQGTRAFYFKDALGDRYYHKSGVTGITYRYVTRCDTRIAFYDKQNYAGGFAFIAIEFDNEGVFLRKDVITITTAPTTEGLRYDADDVLELFTGTKTEFDSAFYGANAVYSNVSSKINFDGLLTPYMDFPYGYNDIDTDEDFEISVFRILQDLAITFNGFFSLHLKKLNFITQDATSFIEYDFDEFTEIDKNIKYLEDLEYTFSTTLAEIYADFLNYLEKFYTTNYGGKAKKHLLTFRTDSILDLLTKINKNRVNQINRREIYNNYYEYKVETLETSGGVYVPPTPED